MNSILGKQAIGKWCKRGAWLIVLLDLFQIVNAVLVTPTNPLRLLETGSIASFNIASFLYQPTIPGALYAIFYAFVLYAIGLGCERIFGQAVSAGRPFPRNGEQREQPPFSSFPERKDTYE